MKKTCKPIQKIAVKKVRIRKQQSSLTDIKSKPEKIYKAPETPNEKADP